jgi:hypothetical protein
MKQHQTVASKLNGRRTFSPAVNARILRDRARTLRQAAKEFEGRARLLATL